MGINPLSYPGVNGGGYYPQPQPQQQPSGQPENQTMEYLQLLQRAGGDDNKLSKQELQTEIQKLTQQKDLINSVIENFGDFFGGQANYLFQAIKKQIDVRLSVANKTNDNFDGFDAADEDDDLISRNDIIKTANKDGNVYDISNRDLGLPVETPKDLGSYFKFFQAADRDGGYFPGMPDGKLTVDEIDDLNDMLTDRIEKLEAMKELYPTQWQAAINFQIDEMQKMLNVGNRIKNNFTSLDAANNSNTTDGKITYGELYKAAQRDNDPSDLSDQDLIRPPVEEE